jgi:hypothetical protein
MNVLGKTVKIILTVGSLVGVLAIVGIGCSEGGGKPNPQNITEKNLCDEQAKIICYDRWNCCTGKELETEYGETLTINEDKCRVDEKLKCEDDQVRVLQAVASGKVAIDTVKATACLKLMVLPDVNQCFIEPTDLTYIQAYNDNCFNFNKDSYPAIQGLVPAGSDCAHDFECVSGTTCVKENWGLDVNIGKCRSKIGKGEDCLGATGNCKEELYCASTVTATTGSRCGVAATCACADRKASGLKCCDDSECAEGLYCEKGLSSAPACTATTINGTCKARKALGEACSLVTTDKVPYMACADYLDCEIGICSNDNKRTCSQDSDCNTATVTTNTCKGLICGLSSHIPENFCSVYPTNPILD